MMRVRIADAAGATEQIPMPDYGLPFVLKAGRIERATRPA